ncbi:MAG: beta-lactamase family protein, partial [Bacteroidales bacterium]|nr:beta-lactamase family protein [Bacteroidales bacterium]
MLFFVGELIFSFSIKKGNSEVNHKIASIPYSHRLSNVMSDTAGYRYIDSVITVFREDYDIKGLSVAISDGGRLIYARGFGYADAEKQEEVEPRHMFRIASVSKLITASAILKLVEEGRVNLQNRVFGPGSILARYDTSKITDPRALTITIDNLLKHTSGLYNKKGDVMFMTLSVARALRKQAPANMDMLVEFALSQPLDNAPGAEYDYSNLGYSILGEVIEQASGMPYEEFVHFYLLEPLGITSMKVGKSYLKDRDRDEVKYYEFNRDIKVQAYDGSGHLVSQVYGGNPIELLAASGGWLASPAELMKFILAIDGDPATPDILAQQSIAYMTTPYGKDNKLVGWKACDGHGTMWRTGTLTGASALVMKQ